MTTTDTTLAVRNGNTALATPTPADYIPVAGYEGLTADDFSLPTLKLVQAQTTADGAEKHQGHYLKTDTGEFFEQPAVLIVGIQKSRIVFPPEYTGDKADPLCRSDDAQHPRDQYIGSEVLGELIGGDCASCALSKWPDEGGAPACTLSENWAAVMDTGDLCIVRFKGSSARTSAMLKNMMRANRLKKRPTYVRLGSTFEKGDKGRYYVATVTPIKEPVPAEVLAIAAELVGINLAARAADELAEDAETKTRTRTVDLNDLADGRVPESEYPF